MPRASSRLLLTLLGVPVMSLAGAAGRAQPSPQLPVGPDHAAPTTDGPPRAAEYGAVAKSSAYITMSDGVRIAADVYVPKGARGKLPTVLTQTRYYRSAALAAAPQESCKAVAPDIAYLAQRGYAVVVTDVRGTGASFGSRTAEYSNQEVRDGSGVADWIVAQPWSNGRIGVTGISYYGTTAEMMLRNHHRAVVAAVPISDGYDFYADVIFPGGLRNVYMSEGWSAGNRALDNAVFAGIGKLKALAGPCPVDADADGALMRQAIAGHAHNAVVADAMRSAHFRDDMLPTTPEGWPSPYRYREDIDAGNIPFLQLTAWTDSGYTQGAINRLLNSTNPAQRLLIAAGSHGIDYFYGPGTVVPTRSGFDLDGERVRFFDRYLRGMPNGYDRLPRVRWFTTGENRWRGADTLPLTRQMRWNLTPGALLPESENAAETVQDAMPADIAAGRYSRWDTTLGAGPVAYPDRAHADAALISFTGPVLDQPVTLTGNPVLRLTLRTDAADTAVIAYLEEVTATGEARYVTEGELLASARGGTGAPYRTGVAVPSFTRADARPVAGQTIALTIAMHPMAHRFAAGSRVRVVLGGADAAHFATPKLAAWRLSFGPGRASLALPVLP
ncbi:MAG: CocE/NonD family hydrolase [Thermohalobaculum sp.]